MSQNVRALLIAEAANPEWVSVPLGGWSLANAIQEQCNAHIVTQIRNREAFLRAGKREGIDFTAIDSEAVSKWSWKAASALRFGKGKGWTMVTAFSALDYYYFERLVWKAFRDDIASGRFDLVHRITPLTPTAVSPIAAKCKKLGVPFVMGPLNGGLPWPAAFDAERRREGEWLSYVRGAHKLMPWRKSTLDSASAIITGSKNTYGDYPEKYHEKCIYMPGNGIIPSRFPFEPKAEPTLPLKCCFVGRLVPYKGLDMVIESAAEFMRQGLLTLDVIGDGPELPTLKAQAEREGVTEAINFRGFVPHTELAGVVRQSDLLTFPSVREFGGAVVIEAMTIGVVPLVVDYGGPGEHVNDSVGYTVPIGTRAEIVANLRTVLERIVAAPHELTAKGERGRKYVLTKLLWPRKAEQVRSVYDWVLGRRATKPTPFGTPGEEPKSAATPEAINDNRPHLLKPASGNPMVAGRKGAEGA